MKKLLSALPVFFLAISLAGAQATIPIADVDTAISGFLTEVNSALPDNAVAGTTWSDAYIGSIVGVPPHFGIGFSVNATKMNFGALEPALQLFGASLPSGISGIPLPNYAVEARIGGFILPFDIGVRFGAIPSMVYGGIKFDYFSIGGDIRYALMEEGLVKPDITLGAGVYYSRIGIGYTNALLQNLSTYTGTDPTINVGGETVVIDFKAQISKNFVIVTPYAGVGASLANTTAKWSLATAGGSKKSDNAFSARVFGGASVNLLILKIDISGMYNIMSQNWGASIGTRIQL